MDLSVGKISVTEAVTNKDAHFFSNIFTWYSIVLFIYPRKNIFILFKQFWIRNIGHLVISTRCFIIYYSLYNSLENSILDIPFFLRLGSLVGFIGRAFPGPWLVSLCSNFWVFKNKTNKQ